MIERNLNSTIEEYIKQNEGRRLVPYLCSANRITIGYGRNLDDVGISINEAELLFENDLDRVVKQANQAVPSFDSLDYNRQKVVVDMVFNLGVTRFKKFKKMLAAIADENWEEAANQLLDSRYAKQLPNRSSANATLMRSMPTSGA